MENEINFPVGVILPAAGSGERLGNAFPKQYFEIQGKPLFLYAIEVFEDIPWVVNIVLVSDDIEKMNSILIRRKNKTNKISVIKGGNTRHKSIKAGLDKILATSKCEVLVVHDAVRPLLSHSLLTHLVQTAHDVGVAGLTRPLISTVVSADQEGYLTETLDRSKFLNSETPQAFKTSILFKSYQNITIEELERGTECLQLVLKHCGVRAKLLEGTEELWKVTFRRDLHSAIGCISANTSTVCIMTPKNIQDLKNEVLPKLLESLHWRVSQLKHIVMGDEICSFNEYITSTFNKLIVFYTEENFKFPFIHFMDTDTIITIIHVIIQSSNLLHNKYDYFNKGQQLINSQIGKEKCCNVVIFVNNVKKSHNLISMITTLIFSNSVFQNQILFV